MGSAHVLSISPTNGCIVMALVIGRHSDELGMIGPVQVQRVVRVGRFWLQFWNINWLTNNRKRPLAAGGTARHNGGVKRALGRKKG